MFAITIMVILGCDWGKRRVRSKFFRSRVTKFVIKQEKEDKSFVAYSSLRPNSILPFSGPFPFIFFFSHQNFTKTFHSFHTALLTSSSSSPPVDPIRAFGWTVCSPYKAESSLGSKISATRFSRSHGALFNGK